MKKYEKIVATVSAVVISGALTTQATSLLNMGFEFSEGNSTENGQAYWQGDGTPIHGIHIAQPDTDPGGNFSITDDSNAMLVDDGNARSGSQSVRLSKSGGGGVNYLWYNFTSQGYAPGLDGVETDIDNSVLPVRIGWSLYRPDNVDDIRHNGLQTTSFAQELWQMRVYSSGVTFEYGGPTASSTPSSPTGWFDFQIDADFNAHQFIGARYRHESDGAWTELLAGPADFKGSIAAPTFQTLVFRPDNTNANPDLAWDDIYIEIIPEPSIFALLAIGGLLIRGIRRRK